ncbi:MAG: 16S rRNA (guanine(966)-N(2))-methyltransferase RsmD [Gammaproteobacteria bacterium]|nr:16S rRNA (guanine(966)-N(2))-methyltransferase RsmD [Gammaproteobacteria bacterium]
MKTQLPDHTLRIIGGNWRGRKVSFANEEAVRPTPSRVRETLFNWLQGYVPGARCLELYAGSGILSIEALSRGAGKVVLLDKKEEVISHLSKQFKDFLVPDQQYKLINQPAGPWLAETKCPGFDLIFLDPPFAGSDLGPILNDISAKNLAKPGGWIYIESSSEFQKAQLPGGWIIHRQKRAGAVHYCLCKSLPIS